MALYGGVAPSAKLRQASEPQIRRPGPMARLAAARAVPRCSDRGSPGVTGGHRTRGEGTRPRCPRAGRGQRAAHAHGRPRLPFTKERAPAAAAADWLRGGQGRGQRGAATRRRRGGGRAGAERDRAGPGTAPGTELGPEPGTG